LFHWADAYSTCNARGPGDPGLRRDDVLTTSVSTLLNRYESITLYFEDEPSELEGYDRNPSLFSMMDLGEVHV
jgi:hypothetical protein